VTGVGDLRSKRMKWRVSPHFQIDVVGAGPEAARETWEVIEADGSQELLGFGTVADGAWQTARFRAPERMAQLAGEHSEAWRGLAVAVLQRVVLEKAWAPTGQRPKCQYVHLLREVQKAVASKQCQVATLVPPATMDHVAQ